MALTAALNTGRTGLQTAQRAVEVTGNNLSNLATNGYHRRRTELAPLSSQRIENGQFIGRGVKIDSIHRVVDHALESRLRDAAGKESRSLTREDLLSQIESIENELTDVDLSSDLNAFFNSFSELANKPRDLSQRSLVVQKARTLADHLKSLRQSFNDVGQQTDQAIGDAVRSVNDSLNRIARLNDQIAQAEAGPRSGEAGSLRDQRGEALSNLAKSLDISTVEQNDGEIDVFVGSLPIVLNGESRGVKLQTKTVDGQSTTHVVVAEDGSKLDISSGKLGAQIQFRERDLADAQDTLDKFAGQLIYQTNRVHSQGQPLVGYSTLTATNKVDDSTAALNIQATNLAFEPHNGSFKVHLRNTTTGLQETRVIDVDLDGINPGGDTTLQSLTSDLNAVAGLNASVSSDGKLTLTTASDASEISFSEDTSGVLASLGLGSFFTGKNAFDIDVNQTLSDPNKLAAAQGNLPGDNRNALALANLGEQGLAKLDGSSLTGFWDQHVADLAGRTAEARDAAQANSVIRENLTNQQQALSGVNADEETINLIQNQRAYQASARFIGVVDEMLDTLLSLA